MSIINFGVPKNDFDDSEDCVLYIPYDALDVGSILLDNSPCIKIATSTCEDKNDTLVICEDILIHGSSILFINSPNYTIKEKYACVEKFLCGLKISYAYEKSLLQP
jgi:hypothetical protein